MTVHLWSVLQTPDTEGVSVSIGNSGGDGVEGILTETDNSAENTRKSLVNYRWHSGKVLKREYAVALNRGREA